LANFQIQVQQKACEEILEKRQDLIEDLKQGIDDNDWEFEHNLELYQKDVMLMGDRIDDLVEKLRDSFVEELQLIEVFEINLTLSKRVKLNIFDLSMFCTKLGVHCIRS